MDFVFQAVKLLKKGGVLVYSTCTVTLAENEEQVAWALRMFPCLSLQPQVSLTGTKRNERHQIITYCFFSSGAPHWIRRHAGSWAVA